MLSTIFRYFPELAEEQKEQLSALSGLYQTWNKQINVISRKDIDYLYLHHVLHSLTIAKVVQFLPDAKILDLGTGGGFPGIPLAILFPQSQFILVDSVGKKIKVAQAVAYNLGLKNIKTISDRIENISGQYDFVVSRAVAELNVVWGWAEPKIDQNTKHNIPNGLLYLKGGQYSSSLPKGVGIKDWQVSNIFEDDYFIDKALILLYRL